MAGMPNTAGAKRPAPLARRAGLSASRLAAALGLTPLVDPAGSGVSLRRAGTSSHAALLASARKRIGGRWHTAASPQHVRAILQVCQALMSWSFIMFNHCISHVRTS